MSSATPNRINELSRREIAPRSAAEVGRRILKRADAQRRHGIKPFSKACTGLPAVDALARSWWGLTLLSGDRETYTLTLAARIALATARARGSVLWLAVSGDEDAPVFRLLTGLASVPARSVFVERDLTASQRTRLARAINDLEGLPIRVADAHGRCLAELRATCFEMKGEGTLDLVIVDAIDGLDRQVLCALEELAEDLDVPLLAVAAFPVSREISNRSHGLPLRQGSLLLHVVQQVTPSAKTPRFHVHPKLEVSRVGEDTRESIVLMLDQRHRWIEPRSELDDGACSDKPSGSSHPH